ncbi:MAG: hypothetical protein ACOX1K_02210 [Defluviitoga tunisiensis]
MCRRRFLFICILIAVSLLSFSNSLDFAGGSGSKEDPFLVSNSNQLYNIRHFLDKHFKQISDIDLSTYEDWEPIGKQHFSVCQGLITGMAIRYNTFANEQTY